MWRLISTKAYRVRLRRAAWVRTPDVLPSSRSHCTDVKGFHNCCLCTPSPQTPTSSCRRSFPLKAATLPLSAVMKVDLVSPPARAAKAAATVCLSKHNSCEEVWWRRVVIIKHCSALQRLFLRPAVLDCPAGGPGGEGRTTSCWKQPSSCPPLHPFCLLFIWEDCGLVWSCWQSFLNLPFILQLCSQLSGVFNGSGQVRPESPRKAEPWICVRSCGLPLLCRYLLWTSSSRSQLGRGWPIL